MLRLKTMGAFSGRLTFHTFLWLFFLFLIIIIRLLDFLIPVYWHPGIPSSPPQRKEEVQLMNVTLNVYTRIFSSILQRHHRHQHGKSRSTPLLDQVLDTKRNKVASDLVMLKEKMEKLKENLCHLNDDREDIISKLNKLEVSVVFASKLKTHQKLTTCL